MHMEAPATPLQSGFLAKKQLATFGPTPTPPSNKSMRSDAAEIENSFESALDLKDPQPVKQLDVLRRVTQTTHASTGMNASGLQGLGSPSIFGNSSVEPFAEKTLTSAMFNFEETQRIPRPTMLQDLHVQRQEALPSKLLAAASGKKRSWSESSSAEGSASKNSLLAPKPLAVQGKFVFDEHNGGGRKRKQRHKSRIAAPVGNF